VPKAQLKIELFNIPLFFCSFAANLPFGQNKLGNYSSKQPLFTKLA
jgi:hypothetical protein